MFPQTVSGKSTRKSLRFIILLGNCFGLLPISDAESCFKWKSLKVFYSMTLLAAGFATLVSGAVNLSHSYTFHLIGEYGFYVNWVFAMLGFFRLAMRWPRLMRSWSRIDGLIGRRYGYPQSLDRRLKVITVVIMSLAAIEHSFVIFSRITLCKDAYGTTAINVYYTKCIPNFFSTQTYNHFLAVLVQVNSFFATFTWSYNDLFIIVVSDALAARFQQIKRALEAKKNKALTYHFWKGVREDYVLLSNLCFHLDSCVSFNVSVSFASNLFSILVKFFETLNPIEGTIHKSYFAFSFAFLLFRTVQVTLHAAWIHDESRAAADFLFSVPSSTYNLEVQRFLVQISFDNVALTGSQMYKVTRGMILNIAGAIVTYGLILIQFRNSIDAAAVHSVKM